MRYNELIKRIEEFKDISGSKIIGQSLFGEKIYSFHIGKYQGPQILLSGGMHAREYITTLFLIEEIKYLFEKKLNGGIYIIPLINPDGVRIVLEGVGFIPDDKLKRFLVDVNDGENFNFWKANGNGIDLNVNFDAKWGKGKSNLRRLAKENFIGYYPNSEVENLNIIKFLQENKIDVNIAYHSKGEVIYYGYEKSEKVLLLEKKIVNLISSMNGYVPVVTKNSTGGLSDFISQEYDIPSMTIELGNDRLQHPIKEVFLEKIFNKNKDVPISILDFLTL